MEDNKRKLYDALSQDYDLGSFEQFSNDIADETKRRKLYDATSEEYDYGDFDTFSSQLGFGKAAQPAAPAPSTEPENPSADLEFNDEPDTRALKPSRRDMIARQQEAMRKEEEEARKREGKTPQQRTSAFNLESQERDRRHAKELAERNPEKFLEAQAEEKAVEDARKAELAAQRQTAEDVQRFGTGNENYSFEEGVAAGRAFAEIAPEIESFDENLAAFNDKYRDLEDQIAQINAGKLKLSPEEYKRMQARYSEYEKESKALADIAKRYDAVLNTAPGKEYKDISDRLNEIAKGPKSAKSAYDYALVYAELQRNPLYRASLGEDAPSEDEINAGLLQGQIAYLDEKMKTAKGNEKKELKKAFSDAKEALYANPWYKQHLESKIEENKLENEQIGVQRAELVQQLRAGYAEQGIDPNYYWQMEKGEPELQRFDAAAHMHDDAIREYEKPTKYDDSKGRKNVAKGVGDWASDTDTWSFGIEGFVEDIAVVRPVLEKVEKIAGNVNEDDIITNGTIDELEKQLTPGELAVLDAYFEKVGAVAAKGADTSVGYQIGQGIGDMITLGLEMVATGGAGGAVRGAFEKGSKKALVKLLGKRAYRKVAKSGAGRVALWAGSKIPADIVETAVRMPFMPSTYKNLGEKAVTLDEGYKTRSFKEYAPEAAWDQFVEQLTEVSNGFAFPLMGKIVKTPGMQKLFKETIGENGVRALKSFMERGDIKLLDDAMLGSFGGEWEEELLGAVIHSVTDDPKALSDFFSAEQQLVLLGTLAPLPISRGAVGGVQLAVPAANAAYRWNRAEAELKRLGLDEGRISRIKEVLDNGTVPEGARAIMEAMRDAGASRRQAEKVGMQIVDESSENEIIAGSLDAIDGNAYGELARYFWAAQQKRAVGLMGEVEQDRKVEAKRAELEQTYGGQFYHKMNGEDVVETATMQGPDGTLKNIFVTSETPNASGEMSYVGEDGSKGFVRQDEIGSIQPDGTFAQTGETTITPVNRYLAGLVMQDAQVQEVQGMARDAAAVNQSLRQQVEALGEVTYNGQTGTISRASSSDDGAVFVPDDGENVVVPWEELASQNGIAVPEIVTQEENAELGADAVVQRMAEQQQIADAFHEAYSAADRPGAFIDTDEGRMAVIDIIEDTINPEDGTAEFTVRQPDGTRNVTMRTSIERVMAGLQGQPAPAEEPATAPEEEPVAEQPAEEPDEAPAEDAPKIPVDKDGNKIYDAPGVSVEDALEDIYSTEGVSEEMADQYIREMAAEAEKGRNPKRGKMTLAQWGEATSEAARRADFWKEMKEFADANTAEREREQKEEAERQERIKQYGVDPATFDMTPQTVEEAVAEYLGNSEKLIDLDDAIRETLGRRKDNRVPRELFRHLGKGGILVKNGGRSVQDVANDIVGEYEGTLSITQDDVRTAIIDALLGKTKTELRDTIFDNRLEEARNAADMFSEEPATVEEPAPAPVVEEPEPAPEPEPEPQPEPAPEPETPVEEPAEEPAEETEAPAEDAPAEEPEATEEETTEQPAAPVQAQPTTPEEFGSGNTIFTKEAKDKARETILRKLKGQLNAGIDPEMLTAMIQYCGYYIEAGVRAFTDFAKSAIADLGDAIRPYLKSMYNAVRDYPDMGEIAKEMTPYDEVAAIDVNTIGNEEASVEEVSEQPAEESEENEENPSESREESVTLEGEEEAREKFTDTVANRLIASIASGERPFKSITDLRKAAREAGMEVDERGATDILLQELAEVAIVRAARKFMSDFNGGLTSRNAFNAICKLYDMQPTISMRSSQRVAMQQYSTPLPMSFVAQMFAYKAGMQDVLEPTAGNGMLVFGIPADKVHANELDEIRKANLDKQGFKEVTQNDATEPFSGEYDAVVANPPFGSHDAVSFDGKSISGLDPIITLRALDAMKDDGRAAIIIGGNVEWADNGSWKTKKAFFSYLYDHYNVKGVVNMGGQLYNKQGTNYPTMMILIDGRRSEAERAASTVYPPVRDKARGIATTNDELYDIVTEILNDNRKTDGNEVVRNEASLFGPADDLGSSGDVHPGNGGVESAPTGTDRRRNDDRGVISGAEGNPVSRELPADDGVQEKPNVGRRFGDGDASGNSSVDGGRGRVDTVSGSSSGPSGPGGRDEQRDGRESRGDGDGLSLRTGGYTEHVSGNPSSVREPVRVARKIKDRILSYIHHSRARSLESVAPAAMVEDMDASIQKIEKDTGRTIDDFVTEELGYESTEQLHKALAAEQIDSVAMAIYQMNHGKAMIIGDQTGVGKGRQVAALIRWANRQGKKPIFMTKDAKLFSDMYRDLRDIGSGDLKPLILNSADQETNKDTKEKHWKDTAGVMLDEDGNVVYRSPKSGLDKIIESGKVPDEYDYVVLTYSQLNSGDAQSLSEQKKKAKDSSKKAKSYAKTTFIRSIANDNYLLLDESHTAAGGDSKSGGFLRSIMKSVKGVTFASATFAKRPDTMPLYAIKSAMSEANVEPDKLIGMIEKGGVTLQEIMARALTRSGQMARRERDMSEVKTDWKTVDDPATAKKARADYDRAIEIFNKIIQFQRSFIKPVIDDISSDLAEMASSASETSGTKNFGVDNPPFVSQTYNFTKQLMLALKAEAIVDEVVKEIKAGRHPVIALENTYESGLDAYAVGDKIEDTSFSAGLLRSLGRILQYTVTDPDGNKSQEFLTPEELGPDAAKQYYALQDEIREATKGIFLSPLDLIKERLTGMGYNVGEVTGRKTHVVKEDDGYYRRERAGDSKQAVRDFNSGASDVIIINKSGATGISLHSSVAFKDQRPRSMIIAQPLGDINDYMQMIGRIDRTGQVHRGYYINLSLPVPAELRFNMMLASKLKSLNANTTTNQESDTSSVDAPDFLNKYGSQVVIEYLRDNPDVFSKLIETDLKLGGKNPVTTSSELENYRAMDDDVQKVTGRIALLPVEEQEKFYADISERYNTLIKYLDETGENTLKITTLPLKAKTLARRVGTEGKDPNGNNPFAQNSYVERVEVDVLRKPMKADEIRKVRETLSGGKEFGAYRDELVSRVNEQEKTRLAAEEERYNREKEKTQKEIEKQIASLEAKVKNMDEVTRKAEVNRITNRLTANLEEKHQANVAGIKSMHRKLRDKFEQFNTDDTYLIYEELEGGNLLEGENAYSPALFCGFKTAKAGENLTPSTSVAVFATLDGRRRLEIKFTSESILDEISNFTNRNYFAARNTTIDNWDSSISNASREERYILTGNILQAWDDATKEGLLPGRLVSYTDIDGNIKDGILMNQSWQPTSLRSSGAPINSRTEQILNGESVRSTDGEVEIQHEWGDTFSIYVPKTKKAGAKYFENKDILGLIFRHQGFHQHRGRFTATVTRDNMRALLNILGNMGVRVNTEENESAWEEVGQDNAAQQADDDGVLYRPLEDQQKIKELDKGKKVRVYRSMQVIDGQLYPPMSARVEGRLREPTELGAWEESEEHPEMADADGNFVLDKGNGKSLKAAYAPYVHTRRSPLNEQFSEAYNRPNLVIVEGEIPESELTSGYTAEGSKKAVGEHDWPSGKVSNALAKQGKNTRKVILSRWFKPLRVVPNSEVADIIADLIGDSDISFPYNVVTPGLRTELQNRGIEFEGWQGNRPKNADSLIASMQPQFNRSGENLSSPIDRARAITTIDGIAKKLGVKFEQDSSLKAKGAFNPKTGKIRINIDAHKDTADLEATLLHEAVAHYGLRKLFGKDWRELRSSLYEQASPEIKAKVDALAKKDGLSTEVAMEEYIAQLAEDGRFDAQEESFWQRIVTALKRLLAKIGFNSGYLTDEDFRAMLYASYRNLQTGGALETAARIGVYQALRRNADSSHEDNGPEDDGPDNGPEGGAPVSEDEDMLNRDISDLPEETRDLAVEQETGELYRRNRSNATALTAAEAYNSSVRTMGQALREVVVDEYAPVDNLTEALVNESGKRIKDNERVSDHLREVGGKAMDAIRSYDKKFLRPMWDAVASFRKAAGDISIEDTETYIGLKSGLERNEVFAKRDAKRDYQQQYEDAIDGINAEEKQKKALLDKQLKTGAISDVTYQGEITLLQQEMNDKRDQAAAARDAHFADVDAGTDERYAEYRKKDYSAITAWAGTDDVADAEALAADHVDELERAAGASVVKEMWKRINAATKETLKFQYEHDMLTRDQYRDISRMLNYYVPMRGFAEDTAEDLFNYYVTSQSNDFQPTILSAKGRHTMYEGPLGNIGAMHSSAISQGVKNQAKLALLNLVRNRKDNTLATITRAWFVKTGQKDANGKDIYEVAYPQVPENADFATRQSIVEQFEEDMKQLKEQGDAYNAHREVDLRGGVVAFEKESHKNEHIVQVREGGKEYGIIINGNPAAAQAINGVRRGKGAGERFLGIMRNWTRMLSQMFTTFSVPFWVSNFQRDFGQGLTNTFIRNDKEYLGKYLVNYVRAFKVFPLIVGRNTMDNALAKGDSVAQLYQQYLENGGPMGQTRLEDNEYFEKQMQRYLDNSVKTGIVKGATGVLESIGRVGEAVETVTRFAVFMTSMQSGRPLHQSISDAKEVSTNFARKGSGRSFTKDELDRMRHADGRPLNSVEKGFVNAVSIGVEIFRATVPFFNAAVQGLENKGVNYSNNFGKTLLADSIYFMAGLGMMLLRSDDGGDDDKEKYSHTSDYLRRNNLLVGLGDGLYGKWALPQEYRVCYSLGDIVGSAIKQQRPIDDLAIDAFGALMQLSPTGVISDEVLFSAGDKQKAWENLVVGISPGVAAPVFEAIFNRDFKGARLYNEGFNDNNRLYPGWTKALNTTGEEYVKAAETLNKLQLNSIEGLHIADDAQNRVERGLVNLNPAIVEHLVESYFSGPYQIVVRIPEAIGKAVSREAKVRDIPLLNRLLLNANDNKRDAYYSNMYYYFKGIDTETSRIYSEYRKTSPEHAKEMMGTKDYQYMLIFKKYDKMEKQYRKRGKTAENEGDIETKNQMDEKIQSLHEQIAKECLDIYFDRDKVK